MPSTTVNYTRGFRPLRWLACAIVACLLSYLLGLAVAPPSVPSPTPPACQR